jgi:hypothetical protein
MLQYPGSLLSSTTSYKIRENQYDDGDTSDNRRKGEEEKNGGRYKYS